MKCRLLWLTAIFSLLMANITIAQETDGYLVKLKPTAAITIEHEDGYMVDQLKYAPQYIRVESMEELEQYIGMENVEYVEPRYELELFSMPDDPCYDEQWAYTELRAEYAHLAGIDGKGVRIGVIDSGLRRSHEDFVGADIEAGENFSQNSKGILDPSEMTDYIDGRSGHGTAVIGVIAAQTDNGKGGCGLAPGATVVPLRIYNETAAKIDWVIEAVYAAVDKYDCDIINMSFGMTGDSEALREAVQYAYEQGVIIFAAVGNYGTETKYYPASYDEVIGVGSVDEGRERSSFCQYNDSLFITAPGGTMHLISAEEDDAYMMKGGTSFSTPAMAAMAALAMQADPTLTAEKFCELLLENAEDLGKEGYDVYYGNGFVEIEDLLKDLGVSLQMPEVKEEKGRTEIYGHFEGMTPLERKTVILGGYNAHGKLCSLDMKEYTVDKIGVMTIDVIFEKARSLYERISLFRMDGEIPVPMTDVMELI